MVKLTLLSRIYCSLCRQMHEDLLPLQKELSFEIEVVDIDDFPALVEKYDELVPVLLHGETEICHWHLDEAAVRAYFTRPL